MSTPGIRTHRDLNALRAYRAGYDDGIDCERRAAATIFRWWWFGVGFAIGVVVTTISRHI